VWGRRTSAGRASCGFLAVWSDAWYRADATVPVEIERGGTRMQVAPWRRPVLPARYFQVFITSLANAIGAVIILARARPSRGATAMFFGLAIYATMYMAEWVAPGPLFWVSFGIACVTATLAPVAFVFQAMGFPDEAGGLKGRNLLWPWLFVGLGLLWVSIVFGVPFDAVRARELARPFSGLWIVTQLTLYTLNYRRSSPAGRRQVKWVLYLAYVGALMSFLVFLGTGDLALTTSSPRWASLTIAAASVLFPASLIIAMLRSDLFDVDRIVGATVSYNVMAIVVVGGGLAVVPPLTAGLAARLGLDPSVGRTVIAIGLAAVVIITERRLRPYIDRLFFKERFALEQVMQELPERFAAVRKADGMWTLTGETLVANLRPANCLIFLSAGDTFVPVFADGDALPAALDARTPLVAWIDALPGAVKVDARVLGPGAEGRAMLESLGARVVVPIHRGRHLEAFLLLGEKRSGDIFTATDLTLLTSLGKTASSHMLRFDEAELLERAKAMQEKMRRYVPGAVAEAIALGDDLATGEREVSVLFVDIRGYTAFADGREATDIFSTINRYTETASKIVTENGGVVVEFNGDGMMAVFGAPRPLAEKETSAVRAARALVDAVPRIAGPEVEAPVLRVGVGIATGIAFVGNIEAVDRTIWSAIGSTTNLAARLQVLTREKGASVLIDATTHQRAGAPARDFVRHADVVIRGRKEVETLYGLPLTPGAVA
jgi:class 3 adenylate cyclase